MRISFRALTLVPICAIATLAAAPPPFAIDRGPAMLIATPTPLPDRPEDEPSAKPTRATKATPVKFATPPDGTYAYELSRNGAPQGSTTIALFHRDDRAEIETNEAGRFGAATAWIVASYAYDDFAPRAYIATYRAPFTRDSAIGRVDAVRPHVAFDAPTTVRYDVDTAHGALRATIDGVPSAYLTPAPLPRPAKRAPFVIDAPFMSSLLLLPAFRKRTGAAEFASYSLAFPSAVDGSTAVMPAALRRIATKPHFDKTPKNALALEIAGIGTIWYDPGNGIVDEAHFDALNIDARLTSYSRAVETAAIETPLALATPPHIASRAIVVPDGDVTLGGVIDLPAQASTALPIVVLVPPGPDGERNYDDAGPQPMFVDLAVGLTARGFAVLRYDPRGSGRSPARERDRTWEDARTDARAAIAFAKTASGIDPGHVFVLGYGNGADLALAAIEGAESPGKVAGIVALAPTTTRYIDCARKTGRDVAHPTAWLRSEFGHDASKFAQRAATSLFILQPGIPVCGESADDIATYDDTVRAENPRATVIVASDLSQVFGGRYDADSRANTQAFFPYRFDTSTLGAIADWLAGPHDVVSGNGVRGTPEPAAPTRRPPPPPAGFRVPATRPSAEDAAPGQLTIPSFSPGGPQTPTPSPHPEPSA
jgi:alpha/beta superfamily hydrolase